MVYLERENYPHCVLNFKYYEKATKVCEIFTLLLSYVVVVPVKSKPVKISQNFVAFSEYMNFKVPHLRATMTLSFHPRCVTSLGEAFYPPRQHAAPWHTAL